MNKEQKIEPEASDAVDETRAVSNNAERASTSYPDQIPAGRVRHEEDALCTPVDEKEGLKSLDWVLDHRNSVVVKTYGLAVIFSAAEEKVTVDLSVDLIQRLYQTGFGLAAFLEEESSRQVVFAALKATELDEVLMTLNLAQVGDLRWVLREAFTRKHCGLINAVFGELEGRDISEMQDALVFISQEMLYESVDAKEVRIGPRIFQMLYYEPNLSQLWAVPFMSKVAGEQLGCAAVTFDFQLGWAEEYAQKYYSNLIARIKDTMQFSFDFSVVLVVDASRQLRYYGPFLEICFETTKMQLSICENRLCVVFHGKLLAESVVCAGVFAVGIIQWQGTLLVYLDERLLFNSYVKVQIPATLWLRSVYATRFCIFKYAIPYLTLLFCAKQRISDTIEYKQPVFCDMTANFLVYRRFKQDGLLLNRCGLDSSVRIAIKTRLKAKAALLSAAHYEIQEFALRGYSDIANQRIKLSNRYDQALYYYGFTAIDQQMAALFECCGFPHRVYGYLECGCKFDEFSLALAQTCFASTSVYIFTKVQPAYGEEAFLQCWSEHRYHLLQDATVVSLATYRSPFLPFAVVCDPQHGFGPNVGLFAGLLASEDIDSAIRVLFLVTARLACKQPSSRVNQLKLSSVEAFYCQFENTARFEKYALSIIVTVLDFLDRYVGSRFFQLFYKTFLLANAAKAVISFEKPARILNVRYNTRLALQSAPEEALESIGKLYASFPLFGLLALDGLRFMNSFPTKNALLTSILQNFLRLREGISADVANLLQLPSGLQSAELIVHYFFPWFYHLFLLDKRYAFKAVAFLMQFLVYNAQHALLYFARTKAQLFIDMLALMLFKSLDLPVAELSKVYGFEYQVKMQQLQPYFAADLLVDLARQNLIPIRFAKVIIDSDLASIQQVKWLFVQFYLYRKVGSNGSANDIIVPADIHVGPYRFRSLYQQYYYIFDSAYRFSPFIGYGVKMQACAWLIRLLQQNGNYSFFIRFFPEFMQEFAYICCLLDAPSLNQTRTLLAEALLDESAFHRVLDMLQDQKVVYFASYFASSIRIKAIHPVLFTKSQQLEAYFRYFDFFGHLQRLEQHWAVVRRQESAIHQAALYLPEQRFLDISFGYLSYRKISRCYTPFHYVLTSFESACVDFQAEVTSYLTLRHFVPLGINILAAFATSLSNKADLAGYNGLLVVTDAMLLYIPFVGLTDRLVPDMNALLRDSDANSEDVCLECHFSSRFMLFGSDCELECARTFRQAFLQHIYMPFSYILNVLQHTESHRSCMVDVVLSNGYAYDFTFLDYFNGDIGSDTEITAEIYCGLFYYMCKKLFACNNGSVYCEPYILEQLRARVKNPVHIAGIGSRCIINPGLFENEKLRAVLNNALDQPVAEYIAKQQKALHQLFKDLHFSEMNRIPLFEPFQKQTTFLNYLVGFEIKQLARFNATFTCAGRADRINIIVANAITAFYGLGLVSNLEYLYLINALAGLSNNDACRYPIYPICKDRIFQLPPQVQTPYRFSQAQTKLEYVYEINIVEPKTALDYFNQQVPLHGTYPSNSASTIYYNFRQQGNATALVKLQNNRFDAPDRMFYSYNCMYSVVFDTNSKEHTEDLLYLYTYFNTFDFDLGVRHSGALLDDVSFQEESSCNGNGELDIDELKSCSFERNAAQIVSYSASPLYSNNDNLVSTTAASFLQHYFTLSDSYTDDYLLTVLDSPGAGLPAELYIESVYSYNLAISTVQELQTQVLSRHVDSGTPRNALACIDELYGCLQNYSRDSILQWIRLYFGTQQCNADNLHCYSTAVYLLRVIGSTTIRQELQYAKYFGTMPDRLFGGNFTVSQGVSLLFDVEKAQLVNGAYKFFPSRFIAQLAKSSAARPRYERISYICTKQYKFESYLVEAAGMCLRILQADRSKKRVLMELCLHDWVVSLNKSFSFLLVQTSTYLHFFYARKHGLQRIRTWNITCSCCCISATYIVYFTRNGQIVAIDALNGNLVSCNSLDAAAQKMGCDGYENVYVKTTDNAVHVYSPDLALLGIHREKAPFAMVTLRQRLCVALVRGQTIEVVQFAAVNRMASAVYKHPDQRHSYAHWGHSEISNETELVRNAKSKQILAFYVLESRVRRYFAVAQPIRDVWADSYSIIVQTTDGYLFSLLNTLVV